MRRITSKLPNTTEVTILGILRGGEKFGREVREEFGRRAGKPMPSGSLYTTLRRMENKGLIRSRMSGPTSNRAGNRRRFFKLTALGHRFLTNFEAWVIELKKRIGT